MESTALFVLIYAVSILHCSYCILHKIRNAFKSYQSNDIVIIAQKMGKLISFFLSLFYDLQQDSTPIG